MGAEIEEHQEAQIGKQEVDLLSKYKLERNRKWRWKAKTEK